MMKRISICLFVLTVVGTAKAGYLLPGSNSREEVTGDDEHSRPIDIYPFKYFGTTHRTLYVNTNGAISFGSNVSDYKASLSNLPKLPDIPPIIAPFWSDVDLTYNGGRVWFQQFKDSKIISPLMSFINCSFSVNWFFVATWENVNFYNASAKGKSKRNTYQVVLARDDSGGRSYVMFIYESLEWASGADARQFGNPDTGMGATYALAGFNAGDGKRFVDLPGSFSADVVKLVNASNVGSPGNWIFNVENRPETAGECEATLPISNCENPSPSPTTTDSCHCLRTQECSTASCDSGCQAGWTGDECVVPDCSHGNPCGDHSCQLSGSDYSCSCNHGFENANPWRCEDKNECSGGDVCGVEHTCHNTEGGYFCVCRNKSYTQPNPQICILGGGFFDFAKSKQSLLLKNIVANVIAGFIGTPVIVFICYVLIRFGGTVVRSTYRYTTSEPVEVKTKFVRTREKSAYVFIVKYEDVNSDTSGSDIGPDIGTPAKIIKFSRGTTAYASLESIKPFGMSGSIHSTEV